MVSKNLWFLKLQLKRKEKERCSGSYRQYRKLSYCIGFDVILIETKLIIRTHDRLSIGSVSRLQEFFYPFSFISVSYFHAALMLFSLNLKELPKYERRFDCKRCNLNDLCSENQQSPVNQSHLWDNSYISWFFIIIIKLIPYSPKIWKWKRKNKFMFIQ